MNHYELRPGQKIMPQNNKISYMIRSGAAFISMLLAYPDNRIPVKKTIGIAKPGLIIPGFSEDILFEGETLIVHLLIEPKGVAKIEEIPFEENHKTVFLTNIGYDTVNKDSDTSDMYLCLIRDYYTEAANRHDLIEKNLEKHKNSREEHEKIIVSAYHLKREYTPDSDDKLYQAVDYLCSRIGVAVMPLDNVKKALGKDITVQGIARCSGFLCREIELESGYSKREISPLICFARDDHRPIALYQNAFSRKHYYDPTWNESGKFTHDKENEIEYKAYCIHRPLNDSNLNLKSFIRFGIKEFSVWDLAVTMIAMLLITRLGIEVSNLHAMLYDRIIPQGSINNLINFGLILIGCTVGSLLFSISQNIATFRQDNKIKYSLQAAIYNRVFHMPEKFYRKHESGEMAYRAGTCASSYYTLYNTVTIMILNFFFSWIYFGKMTQYSGRLALAGLLFALLNIVATIAINQAYLKYRQNQSRIMGKIKSYLYQLFSGIDTIRAVGAEDAALYEYMNRSAEWSVTNFKYGISNRVSNAVNIGVTCLSTLFIYDDMINGLSNLSTGKFFGFTVIYGSFTAAMTAVAGQIALIYSMVPMMRNSMEILKTAPEQNAYGEVLSTLKGDILLIFT